MRGRCAVALDQATSRPAPEQSVAAYIGEHHDLPQPPRLPRSRSAVRRARTQIAMRLAKDSDCHLVGIAPTRLSNLPVSLEAAASFADFNAHAWDTLRDRAEQTTQRFSGRKSLMQTNPGQLGEHHPFRSAASRRDTLERHVARIRVPLCAAARSLPIRHVRRAAFAISVANRLYQKPRRRCRSR